MCFRPTDVKIDGKELDLTPEPCPECGELVAPMGTIRLTTCPYCGAKMPNADAANNPSLQVRIDAPSAPAAPAAPAVPGAPAPKPPVG